MRGSKSGLSTILAISLLAGSAIGVVAQDEADTDSAMDMEGVSIDVGGVEYAFTRLPTSVPAGTTLSFTNEGAEVHEMVLNRIADGVTESFEELLALSDSGVDLWAEGYIDTDFGDQMLIAASGQTAEGTITLGQEGRYVALCFIPSGLESAKLEELGVDMSTLGPDTDPSTMSAEVQAYLEEVMGNPPHMAQGMIQEFMVTAEGTEVGPLPDASADEMTEAEEVTEEMSEAEEEVAEEMTEAEEEVAEAREEIDEEKEEAKEQVSD